MFDFQGHLNCTNCLTPIAGHGVVGAIPGYEDQYIYCSGKCAQLHYERVLDLADYLIELEEPDYESR